jgi:hypothetical protein
MKQLQAGTIPRGVVVLKVHEDVKHTGGGGDIVLDAALRIAFLIFSIEGLPAKIQ